MRDWEALVKLRLAGLALEPEETTEVIAEVAEHLEDTCEEMLRQGLTEEEAVRRALSQVGDWKDLRR
ncbi:MAG TPA: permease prefix domain 1-containing protein, partial [Candidatus Acidoferrum sp.]